MSDPYIGEIRMFGGNFPPNGWAMANGQLMPISQNDALFILYGTMYGGDGQETFGLPNLNGRAPMHNGQGPGISQNYQQGEAAGVESVTLTTQQLPVHNHAFLGSQAIAQNPQPTDALVAQSATVQLYITDTANAKVYRLPAGATSANLFLGDRTSVRGIDSINHHMMLFANQVFHIVIVDKVLNRMDYQLGVDIAQAFADDLIFGAAKIGFKRVRLAVGIRIASNVSART